MKIQIWSDYACPYCYIGKRHMETAIQELNLKDIEIEYKSFELDPNAPTSYEDGIDGIIAKKYGISEEEAAAANAGIIAMAAETGLQYDFSILKPSNTFDAHRLYHYAKVEGKSKEFSEAAMKAYFTEGKRLSDGEQLRAIAQSVGLDHEKVQAVLDSNEYAQEVRQDEAQAASLRINGVPFFVINETHALNGAQPVDVFKKVISELY